jgi:hypothetical protein
MLVLPLNKKRNTIKDTQSYWGTALMIELLASVRFMLITIKNCVRRKFKIIIAKSILVTLAKGIIASIRYTFIIIRNFVYV